MAGLSVGVLGIGGVGVAAASALVTRGLAGRVTVYARNGDAARGLALDFMHARPLLSSITVRGLGLDEIEREDIMVITAGHHTTPGESRLDVLHKNVEVMDDIATALEATELPKIVIVVTNPLDVLTEYLTRRWKGQPVSVMGSGTALETLRLTDAVARECGVHPRSVHAWVVGEHGDSCVVLLGSAVVGTLPLLEFAAQRDVPLSPDRLVEIEQEVRDAAYRVRDIEGLDRAGHRPDGERAGARPRARGGRAHTRVGAGRRSRVREPPVRAGSRRPERAAAPADDRVGATRVGAFARSADRGKRVVADLTYDNSPRSRRAAIAAPISSDAVAAGDGAFSTCTARPTVWIAKSSTSSPSGPIAWARTPEGAGARSARSSSGTRRLAAAANRRRLSERAISSKPKRQCRNANRRKPRNANVSRRCRRSMRRHS